MNYFGNITAHGTLYQFPDKPPADLVWTDPKGHENFWCSVTGGTSGSSSNPRTEGRETIPDTGMACFWSVGDAVHSLSGKVRVELAPSSGKVIVAQVHGNKAPDPYLMVTWWNGVARIDVRPGPSGSAIKALEIPCALGEAFTYSLTIGLDRRLTVRLNGMQYNHQVSTIWDAYPFYFKQGAYVIDHDGPADEGGWVVYESCLVAHDRGVR